MSITPDPVAEFRRLIVEEGMSQRDAYRATHPCDGLTDRGVRTRAQRLAAAELTPEERRANRGSRPGERRGGRPPGSPNKATREFREVIRQLLEDHSADIGTWLQKVADEDPDKALQRLAQLAEYAAPKLARTEHVGDGGGPLQVAAVEWHVVDPD